MTTRLHTDEQLEYWGDVFVINSFNRFMRFDTFMLDPHKNYENLQAVKVRVVPRNKTVDLTGCCDGLEAAIDELDTQVLSLQKQICGA